MNGNANRVHVQAKYVGMMRGGCLLAEAQPEQLIQKLGKANLEDTFLHLCHTHSTMNDHSETFQELQAVTADVDSNTFTLASLNSEEAPLLGSHGLAKSMPKRRRSPGTPTWRNFYALLVKNILRLVRNYGLLIFQFLLPALQVILFCVAIGRNPTDLHMAVVNNDVGVNVTFPHDQLIHFSDIYLNQLSNRTIHQVRY